MPHYGHTMEPKSILNPYATQRHLVAIMGYFP